MSTNIDQEDIAIKSFKNWCKFKYKIRWFNSKGVCLILLWTLLITGSVWYHFQESYTLLSGLIDAKHDTKIIWISTASFIMSGLMIVSIPVLGWLADCKLGVYIQSV